MVLEYLSILGPSTFGSVTLTAPREAEVKFSAANNLSYR